MSKASVGVRHVVCSVAEFLPGTRRRVVVDRKAVAIFNVDGRFYGLRDVCPHQGAALSGGVIVSELTAGQPGEYHFAPNRKCIKCPWHGWEYDLETGRSYYDPVRDRVRAYRVAVETGIEPPTEPARIEGPYRADVVRVSTEDAHVVVYV